ncbi:MAG: hypothetical protein E6344_14475 [Clostridium sp.]|nr:hypothetical protein [Clostridium sp.]MDU7084898.1 hypothetical protein [Clostridium sp.]
MEAKDLQKALHIMAWIIIWITGLMIFFLLLSGAFMGEFFILFISIAIVGSIIVLFLFTLEYIIKALDTIATNSYISAKLMEKSIDEKSQAE